MDTQEQLFLKHGVTSKQLHIPHGLRFRSIKFIFMNIFIVCGGDCRLLRGCLYAD